MRRRDALTLLGGAAAWPVAARAQTPGRPLIGYLTSGTKQGIQQYFSGFVQTLRDLGRVEGRDYALEARYAEADSNRLLPLAEDLIRFKPTVIVAGSTPSALAARRITQDVPIVGLLLTDPVGLGLVKSEARSGTNVTGILIRVEGLPAKQLEVARDLAPGLNRVGVLINSSNPTNVIQRREVEIAAANLGLNLIPVEIRAADEIEDAFRSFVRERASTVLIFTDAVFFTRGRQIAAFALSSRIPTVFAERDAVDEGGLISYGVSRREIYHRAAYYVDRILKGEKPDDLPVEFPSKLELVINLATAKAIGLAVPPALIARADEVIE